MTLRRIESPADAAAQFQLTLLSNEKAWIGAADEAGIQKIGIDVERLGKAKRQGILSDARISAHELEDLRAVASTVKHACTFVRLNPLHSGTAGEVDLALALGARELMLPFFRSAQEASTFIGIVGGRARVALLVETVAAVNALDAIVKLSGIDEIMVGLNDLHLELRLSSPMEVAASDLLDRIADTVHGAGLRFGFGGVARPNDASLPIKADLILARYAQTGAQSAWISRSFLRGIAPESLGIEVALLRSRLAYWFAAPPQECANALERLRIAVTGG